MRNIAIGSQSFENIIHENDFYIDKTAFIKEWWENRDSVTLITRPRRFGKTLNMDMLNCFFSMKYKNRSDLFTGLMIWNDIKYQKLQGTYPVIFLSFADIKQKHYQDARAAIIGTMRDCFQKLEDEWAGDTAEEKKRYAFANITSSCSDADAAKYLQRISAYLEYRCHKKVIILLDEYDTPLQEAYTNGYWDDMSSFIRSLFNSTFKTNTSMERGLMTGITRAAKESIFSDMNNIEVVTTTSLKYQTSFGFTQEEVLSSLEEYALSKQKNKVKRWYDGFTFGKTGNIYNPWSILKFLENNGRLEPYWANTSENALISYTLKFSDAGIKKQMEDLMNGKSIQSKLDEQVIFSQLETDPEALWSLFLASGYLKPVKVEFKDNRYQYTLKLTNLEVKVMFENLISLWFGNVSPQYSGFIKALTSHDPVEAQKYLQDLLLNVTSFYDTSKTISETGKSESFYHGFVLGMIVQEPSYQITSNRESGYGRYDVMMKPRKKNIPAIIIEFKVFDPDQEKTLADTADRALDQIEERRYDAELLHAGISKDHIIHYGMGFRGKEVIIHSN